jgi:hypothetical protein
LQELRPKHQTDHLLEESSFQYDYTLYKQKKKPIDITTTPENEIVFGFIFFLLKNQELGIQFFQKQVLGF